jgi:hypothetical protein
MKHPLRSLGALVATTAAVLAATASPSAAEKAYRPVN